MFVHLDYLKEEVDLESTNIDGTRFYKVPSGKMYPSITSVTSFYNRQVFVEWRKRVGEEEANKITRASTSRGTDFHNVVEHYLNNKDIKDLKILPSTKFLFLSAKPYLDRINNIHALERSLYSDYLGLAGRVDCIAEYDGELAVIDFKTATKIKPEKWIENYFVQETAYACMYFEMTDIPVKKLITIMVAENGECVVYEKRNKGHYIKLLTEYIREFVDHKVGAYGESSR
jgi:genome maintenance exonuclease 1